MGRWNKPEEISPEELYKTSEKVAKLTRLFAEENIQVSFDASADTACFYPGSRVLQFPYNFVMLSDDDIMMLFMTHEVGHAFWSTEDYIKKAIEFGVKDEANIVDDIRIERKLKDKYPGLIGTFSRGYRKLYDDGFFSTPEIHPMLSFSNRLNVYAKCGPLTAKNIKFSEKEQDFYNRCMKAETEEDVLELAKELATIGKTTLGKGVIDLDDETLIRITSQFSFEAEFDSDDVDLDETNAPVGQDLNSNEEMSDAERDARQAFLNQMLENKDIQFEMNGKIKAANASGCSFTIYESMPSAPHYTYKDFIEGYYSRNSYSKGVFRQQVVSFMNSISRSVAFMAQEFEMKKAAARYKNAKVSTTGKIDVNRVVGYKYDDNIFAERMVFKDSKRHGMVILLDGSGSISRMFPNMIRQVLLLTEYAKKIGVPFKVFMFGSEMIRDYGKDVLPFDIPTFKNSIVYNNIYLTKTSSFYEVLCSDMSREEYYQAAEILMFGRTSFGGTPTGEAMLRVEAPMNEFFAKHGITNKKLFVITDGCPYDTNSYLSKYVLVDPITEKTYRTNASATYTPISMIGKIFKDRYDIDMVSMVLSSSRRELSDFIPSDSKAFVDASTDKTYNKNKFVKTTDTMGLPIFAIKPVSAETEIDMKVTENSSIASAAGQLAKAMSKMQMSQVLLRALSEQFAV